MDTTERDGGGPHDGGANSSERDSWHAPDPAGSDLVRTSRLAIAACVLGVVSFLLLPGLLVFMKGPPHPLREAYPLITLGASLSATLFGLVSLGRIGLSGGRLTGKAFAWIGVSAPVVQVLLFLFVIMPLGPRSTAFRMTCGVHLSGIGKAMLLYANDYQDEFPRAGGQNSAWGQTADWMASNRYQAYGLQVDGTGGAASISSSLYLLVKYTEVTPKMFLCGGSRETREKGVSEFKLRTYRLRDKKLELIDLWDFGPDPTKHCSYAYQMIYSPYRLTYSSSDPTVAVAGDRNPWMDAPAAKARDFSLFTPDLPPFNGTSDQGRQGNSSRHEGDGQNVMYLDTHVMFEKRSYCGFEDDNIYTSWDGLDKVHGKPPKFGSQPADARDSLLVNDPPVSRKR
jgi:hypothetical protein